MKLLVFSMMNKSQVIRIVICLIVIYMMHIFVWL